jgi:Txe/YoeB family toxin of Txe-Axe toxin-antitoxin module
MNNRECEVYIIDKLKKDLEKLKKGKTEDKELFGFIDRATDDLKKDPTCGIKIPRKLWPKGYIKKYDVDNLWKYDLPNAWRLIYTIVGDEVKIIALILEWMSHTDYERRFSY